MSSAVAMSNVMPPAGAGNDEVTVKVNIVAPALPSLRDASLRLALAIVVEIVPVPWPSATVAPETFVTLTRTLHWVLRPNPVTVTVN